MNTRRGPLYWFWRRTEHGIEPSTIEKNTRYFLNAQGGIWYGYNGYESYEKRKAQWRVTPYGSALKLKLPLIQCMYYDSSLGHPPMLLPVGAHPREACTVIDIAAALAAQKHSLGRLYRQASHSQVGEHWRTDMN